MASRTASVSAISEAAAREVTAPHGVRGHAGEQDRQLVERADLAGEPDLPCGQVASRRVPQRVAPPPRPASPTGAPRLRRTSALAKARRACRSTGAAAAGPSVTSMRQAVQQQVEPAAAGAPAGAVPGRRGRPPAHRRRRPGARRTAPPGRRPGRSRGPGPGRAAPAAWPPSAAAAARRCPGPEANATCPRSRSARARCSSSTGPASAMASRSRAWSNAPACRLACAAASVRSARRAGSAVSAAARSRNAAAAASPPRACARPADRSSSAATSSSGPAAAWARCQARRSGSAAGSVASASAACVCLPVRDRGRPVDRRADQRMPEPHPAAELHQARLHRRLRRRGADRPAARPPATPAPGRRTGRRPRAAAAAGSGPAGRPAAGGSSPRCGRPAAPRRAARTRRPAPPASDPRGSSSSASGLPPRLGDDLVADPRVERPGQHRGQQRPRVGLGQPLDHQFRQPPQVAARGPGARTPGRPNRRASRRATNASTCAEALIQPLRVVDHADQRLLRGRLREQAQHGQADQEPVRAPARHSCRTRSVARRAAAPAAPRAGPAAARTADAARRTPAPSPTARRRRVPPGSPRPSGQVVEQRRLAGPRLAVHDQRPALTRVDRLDQPVQRGALRPAVRQPRRAPRHRETCRLLHDADGIRVPVQRTSLQCLAHLTL